MKYDHTKDYGKDRFTVRQAPYNSWGIWDCMNSGWHSSSRWPSKNDANKALLAVKKRHKR